MCVAKGAPRKPSYGPCNETHGRGITYYSPPQYYWSTATSSTASSNITWSNSNTTANSTGHWTIT